MATYPTSAFAVKAALFAEVQAALPDVEVSYAAPRTAPERETVMFGRLTWTKDDWGPFGQRARDEEYTIAVFINVIRPGDGAQESAERTRDLLAVIEDLLRAAPFPIPARSITYAAEKTWADTWPTDEGYESQINAVVAVTARI